MTPEAAARAWSDIEDERAQFLEWAAGEALGGLAALSSAAADAFDSGRSASEGEALAVQAIRDRPGEVEAFLRVIYLRVMAHFGRRSYEALAAGRMERKGAERGGPQDDDFWASIVDAFIREQAGDLISGIQEGSIGVLRHLIALGVEGGEGIEVIARLLREQFPAYDLNRSRRIARTEVIRASNYGSLEGALATGLDMLKEWISTPDSRTRPSHTAAGGQQVAMTEKFSVGGHACDYPGDPALPAAESIQCRCTIGYAAAE